MFRYFLLTDKILVMKSAYILGEGWVAEAEVGLLTVGLMLWSHLFSLEMLCRLSTLLCFKLSWMQFEKYESVSYYLKPQMNSFPPGFLVVLLGSCFCNTGMLCSWPYWSCEEKCNFLLSVWQFFKATVSFALLNVLAIIFMIFRHIVQI